MSIIFLGKSGRFNCEGWWFHLWETVCGREAARRLTRKLEAVERKRGRGWRRWVSVPPPWRHDMGTSRVTVWCGAGGLTAVRPVRLAFRVLSPDTPSLRIVGPPETPTPWSSFGVNTLSNLNVFLVVPPFAFRLDDTSFLLKGRHRQKNPDNFLLSLEQYYKVSSSYPSLHSTSILNLHTVQLQ